MLENATLNDWLNPPRNIFSKETWKAVLPLSGSVVLPMGLECARRGDAQSLIHLFEAVQELSVPDHFRSSSRLSAMLDTPTYSEIEQWQWAEERDIALKFGQTRQNANYVDLVTICLNRFRDNGDVKMPTHQGEEEMLGIPKPRARLTPIERKLLDTALDAMRHCETTPAPSPSLSDTSSSILLNSVAAAISCPDVVQAFVERGLDAHEILSKCTNSWIRHSGFSVAPITNAMVWGNTVTAWEMSEWAKTKGGKIHKDTQDLLCAALLSDQASYMSFGKTIDTLRWLHPRTGEAFIQEPSSDNMQDHRGQEDRVLQSTTYRHLVKLVHRGMESKDIYGKLQMTMNLVTEHLKYSDFSNSPWLGGVVKDVMEPLMQCELRPDELKEWFTKLAPKRHEMVGKWLEAACKVQCAPVIDYFRPILEDLLVPGTARERPVDLLHALASSRGWSQLEGVQRLKDTVQAISLPSFDALGSFSRHKVTPSRGVEDPDAETTTLMHLIAQAEDHSQRYEAMLALVEMGALPKEKNHAGKTPSSCIADRESRSQWETVLRSTLARQAALEALDDLGLDEPRLISPKSK